MVLDIPNTFIQTDILCTDSEKIIMKIRDSLVDILSEIYKDIYKDFVIYYSEEKFLSVKND